MRTLISGLLLSVAALAAPASAPTFSGTLPVMYIDTEDGAPILTKDTYIKALYHIDPMGCPGVEAVGSADNPLGMQIRGRGNWSWTGFEKKPYRIKLDKKADLLGLGANKHFALMAHADDNYGFLRNPMGFWLSRTLGMPWTPGEEPVEVVLNGDYIGLYFLTETIRVDSDRVDVDKQPDGATDPLTVTGGWLVEIDNYRDDPHILITEGDGSDLVVTYKSPEVLSPEQADYLTAQMTAIDRAVYSADTAGCAWARMVDLETLARFYVVQEVMDNYESFHGSCYLNKQRGDDEKWQFGPVWDFGSAFNYDKQHYIYNGREHHQTWIGQMCRFPRFMQAVRSVWRGFYPGHYREMLDYVQAYADRITPAARADAARWPQYGNADEQAKADLVKERLRRSCAWLAAQWGGGQQETGLSPVTVYYLNDAPGGPWARVYAYSWEQTPDGFRDLYGPWPGTEMQRMLLGGRQVWGITVFPDSPVGSGAGLIFDNGSTGPGNQTADLTLIPGHVYSYDGTSETGVEDVAADRPDAPGAWYDLTGRQIAHPGPGLYIHDGRKMLIRR